MDSKLHRLAPEKRGGRLLLHFITLFIQSEGYILNLFLNEGVEETLVDGDAFHRIQHQGLVEQILELRHFSPHIIRKALLTAWEQFRGQISRRLDHRQSGRLFSFSDFVDLSVEEVGVVIEMHVFEHALSDHFV